MMKMGQFLLGIALFLLCSCSGGEEKTMAEPSSQEHILTEQVRALDSAKEVQQLMNSATEKQRQTLEEQER